MPPILLLLLAAAAALVFVLSPLSPLSPGPAAAQTPEAPAGGYAPAPAADSAPMPVTTVDVLGPSRREALVPGPEAAYDLPACLRRGLALNPRIMAFRYQELGADEAVRAARAAFGFTASVGYGYQHLDQASKSLGVVVTPQDAFSLSLNVTQPLFTGFALLNQYQRAKLTREQAQTSITNAELNLILDIQTNFLALLYSRENVRSALDAMGRLGSVLATTRAFFDVGLKPRLDVLQAETDLAGAERDLVIAQDAVAAQVARLNTLLNLPVDNPTRYEGELIYAPFATTLAQGLSSAYARRPDLIIAARSVEIAEKDAGVAKSGLYPQVAASLNYTRQGDTPLVNGNGPGAGAAFSAWNTGVNMNWQVFDWGRTYHNYKSVAENVPRLVSEYQNLKLEVTNTVKGYHLQIQDAAKRIGVARVATLAAREGYRMAAARYQAQVGTNTEVLDAQARLTRAEADITQALGDYLTAIARFNVAIGIRSDTLAQ
jgi:outer membrane protein TolC